MQSFFSYLFYGSWADESEGEAGFSNSEEDSMSSEETESDNNSDDYE
jgi:hypothetical protein